MKKLTKKEKNFIKTVGNEEIALGLIEVYRHTRSFKYKEAYTLVSRLYKEHPENLWVIKSYAAQHGDYAQFSTPSIEKKRKAESVLILKKALYRLNGVDLWLRSAIRNEYYYHSGQFKKQYDLGASLSKRKNSPHYSKAVGASEYAWQLLNSGQLKRAQKYAKISVSNWEGLGNGQTKHNAFYYQALSISGKHEKALKLIDQDIKNKIFSNQLRNWFKKYKKRITLIH